jgi:DNA-binding MarR family transcriptional regulator
MLSKALAELELTGSQGRIIGYIARAKTAPCARDIEEYFGLTHPTVSGILSRLEKKEFLEFRPDALDRRCKRIYLLPKGEECHAAIVGSIREMEQQLVADFSPQEQADFSALLDRAIRNMGGSPCCHRSKEEYKA